MSKIRIEFECNGDAKEFFNGVMQDYFYSVKNSEDEELKEQYESAVYEIKERPQFYADQIEKILDSDDSFASHIYENGSNLDGATVDLIAAAYDLDGDDMSDEALLDTVREIVLMRSNYLARNK
jgi:hypothetical protein